MPDHYFLPAKLVNRSPRLARFAQRVEGVLFSGLFWLLKRLPLRVALGLGRMVFGLVGPLTRKRKVALENLSIAFPDLPESQRRKLMRKIFANLGAAIVEYVRAGDLSMEVEDRFDIHVSPDLEQEVAAGAPMVFALFHLGAWPLTGAFMVRHGITCTAIYSPETSPTVRQLMEEIRERIPVKMLNRNRSMKLLIKELMAGNSILMLPDIYRPEGDMLPWFGTEVPTLTTPIKLALRQDCPLVPIVTQRLPKNRYAIHAGPAIRPEPGITDRKSQVRSMGTRLNAAYAERVRAAPDQWYCFNRRRR